MADNLPSPDSQTPHYGWRFWMILGSLSITSILSGLDISAISTALPSIVHDLGASPAFPWVGNAYFLTSTAFQPIYGQTANIFGRRSLTLLATVLFAVGSAVSATAKDINTLIGGRVIQGIGGGGINVLIELIVCDLVPLRDRSKFIGVVFIAFAVAVSIGPVVGGAIAERTTWRWIFYLNLPVAGVSLVLLFFFLRVKYTKDSIKNTLKRIDLFGNALLIASVVAILLSLTYAGIEWPWASARALVPLILGLLGLAGFLVLESSKLIPEPTMPMRMFSNRTSLGAFGLTFLHGILTYWITYYFPVYFQSVLEKTPIDSGVGLLPSAIGTLPFAVIAGTALSKWGRYRPWHFIGFALCAIGYGLLTRLDSNTNTGYWIGIQLIVAAGLGVLFTTTLPAIQAPLPEADTAVTTATWGFLRSFGGVWGVAIPSSIFNSHVNSLLSRISDPALRERLANGGAYSLASKQFIQSFNGDPELKATVVGIYTDALKLLWQVGIGFSLLGFVLALVIKEIPLRQELNTEFGIDTKEKEKSIEHDAETQPESPPERASESAAPNLTNGGL
ncbi:multidrug resistance protein Fnx1 [Xylaria intraflava]|nr:multidrug resistance protein Fnx1 [Xylaria intraflava]